MQLYETGFLIAPNLSEEDTEQIIIQMADVVSQKEGRLVKQERWGKRKLAYPIKKFNEAFYIFFHYEGGADIPLELERRFKQSDVVLRYLTLKKDSQEPVRRKKKKDAALESREAASGAAEEPGADENPTESASEDKVKSNG
jgi:small subunit ribosomal protein S6